MHFFSRLNNFKTEKRLSFFYRINFSIDVIKVQYELEVHESNFVFSLALYFGHDIGKR